MPSNNTILKLAALTRDAKRLRILSSRMLLIISLCLMIIDDDEMIIIIASQKATR